ncbi:MAG: cysteine synthase A [Denitrovibrio sp.]|nr:MAG: cysteine synthase A [Denitrovibrio sp.]
MSRIYNSIHASYGNTPVIKLERLGKGLKNDIYLKLESDNPAFSVKDRIARSMVLKGIQDGSLTEGKRIIEPTSGNTGIALAMLGASLGYGVDLVMPDTMSVERRKMMTMLGANIILTPGAKGMKGTIEKADELIADNPDNYFKPSQFDNPANPRIHFASTGPEIFSALDGEIDVFVAGVGTGGTLSGVSSFLKQVVFGGITSVAVEPASSPAISKHIAGDEFSPAPHKVQGIGAGFIPANLNLDVVDRVETVSDDEALEFARRLFKEEGISVCISSGANVAIAYRLASKGDCKGKNIVTVAPSAGERYLSTVLFENI